MSALTKPRKSSVRYISRDFRPLAAGAKIYPGALACVITGGGTSSGYYQQGKPGTVVAVGRFTEFGSVSPGANGVFDNTAGADGAISVEVQFFNPFWIFLCVNDTGSAVVVADRGSLCYVLDDQTVTHTTNSGANGPAGIVYDVTSEGVWVNITQLTVA